MLTYVATVDNTATTSGIYWNYNESPKDIPYDMPLCPSIWEVFPKNNKERSENMRYLYEVILVNPKNDDFYTEKVVAKSETSALMHAYQESEFSAEGSGARVDFDELITNCKMLMEWKEYKSLEKAIETIKKSLE